MEQTAARLVAAIDGLLGGGAAALQLAIGRLSATMWLGEERWRIREGRGVEWRDKSFAEGSPFIGSRGWPWRSRQVDGEVVVPRR
jgi:hypothetical protein